jgi:glucose/arabinose dehydrogenase
VRAALATLVALAVVGAAAAAAPRIRLAPVVGSLRLPVDVTAPRNEPSRLYVVEQRGLVRVVARGRLVKRPFLDLRAVVRSRALAGLLSIAFAPDYARSGAFVVDYVGRDNAVHVVRYTSAGGHAVAASAHELLRVAEPSRDPDNHFGGSLAFGPDGLLYVGVGDGMNEALAQDPASPLGKLLRLDARADAPAPEIVGYGLRNPWRFSFDRATGDLYIADVGANAWEEIDYVRRGTQGPLNFGWPVYEGRARTRSNVELASAPLARPLLVYRHARNDCSAVVGGYVYRGRAIPQLRGRYVYGDFCSARIRSVRVVGGRARDVRTEPLRGIYLLTSFGEDARGELYALSFTYKLSRLYRIAPARVRPTSRRG